MLERELSEDDLRWLLQNPMIGAQLAVNAIKDRKLPKGDRIPINKGKPSGHIDAGSVKLKPEYRKGQSLLSAPARPRVIVRAISGMRFFDGRSLQADRFKQRRACRERHGFLFKVREQRRRRMPRQRGKCKRP